MLRGVFMGNAMGQKRWFDYDPFTGAFETYEYDEDGNRTVITRTGRDLTPALDAIAELHNHDENKHPVLGYRVASIPLELVHKWLVEKGVNAMNPDHWPEVKKLLNDIDNHKLRPHRWRL